MISTLMADLSPSATVRRSVWGVVTLVAVAAGAAIALKPVLLVGLLACPLLAWMAMRPSARLLAVLLGAMLTLQTDGVGAAKVGFLVVLVACFVLSAARVPALLADPRLASFRSLYWVSLLTVILLALTLPLALYHGQGAVDWARDATAFLILASAPMIGIDAASDMSVAKMHTLLAALGLFAAAAFAVTWLARRGFETLPIDRLALASLPLAALPFSYGLTRAVLGPHKSRWLLYVSSVSAILLLTGTRTALVFALGFFGLVGKRSKFRVHPLRAGGIAALGTVVVVVSLPLLVNRITHDPTFLQRRISDTVAFATGEQSDASFIERSRAYETAIDTWKDHPILGTGPGHYFPGVGPGDPPALQVDTPLTLLAKFGILGSLGIIAFLITVIFCIQRTQNITGPTIEMTALRVTLVILLGLVPFAAILEDKGVGLTIMLAICLASTCCLTHRYEASPQRQ